MRVETLDGGPHPANVVREIERAMDALTSMVGVAAALKDHAKVGLLSPELFLEIARAANEVARLAENGAER